MRNRDPRCPRRCSPAVRAPKALRAPAPDPCLEIGLQFGQGSRLVGCGERNGHSLGRKDVLQPRHQARAYRRRGQFARRQPPRAASRVPINPGLAGHLGDAAAVANAGGVGVLRFPYLPIDLVHHQIDGCVHVFGVLATAYRLPSAFTVTSTQWRWRSRKCHVCLKRGAKILLQLADLLGCVLLHALR